MSRAIESTSADRWPPKNVAPLNKNSSFRVRVAYVADSGNVNTLLVLIEILFQAHN